MTPKERFLAACRQQPVDRPPVWMMRQAGRYLPEYRALKEKHNTLSMMQTPELATEITLQPVRLVGVDAAILYSDILMIPDAMGMGLEFAAGEGPRFSWKLSDPAALEKLNPQNLNARLGFVFETIRRCKSALGNDFPLLGFAGAPFTVACYMIHGGSSEDFSGTKNLAWQDPKTFHGLMKILTQTTIDYLTEQADAGVCAVQLFDTWAGLLSAQDYNEFAKPYTAEVFSALRTQGIPSIHYIKGGDYLISSLCDLKNDVLGIDWRTDLATLRNRTQGKFALQGNLDPDVLLASPEIVRERTLEMLSAVPDVHKGYIANLGHGISHLTPVENAKLFVETVKNFTSSQMK